MSDHLPARSGTVGTDEHGAGTNDTCAHLDRVLLGMLRQSVGRDCAPNVERNQTERSNNVFRSLGSIAGC